MLGVRDNDLRSVGVTLAALSTTSLMKATFSSRSMMLSGYWPLVLAVPTAELRLLSTSWEFLRDTES